MKVGTKSVLFGVHQFIIHPIFVLRAWRIIYRSWPTLAEFCAVVCHDAGYWGMPNMDGPEGEQHPEKAASWWRGRFGSFGNEVAAIIIGHSRFHAAKNGVPLSRLFRPDKLATALYPRWLYLLLANLSGEIHEYIKQCDSGKYTEVHHMKNPSQTQWLIEIQAHMALMGLKGEDYAIVKQQMGLSAPERRSGQDRRAGVERRHGTPEDWPYQVSCQMCQKCQQCKEEENA